MTSPASTERATPQVPVQARTLGFLLRELYGQLQASVYQAVAAAGHPGIRAVHSPVLRHLPREGARVADLARSTGMAKQSVAYVVEDLIRRGYLRSDPDPDDGRARWLSYTPRGRRLLDALLLASQQAESTLAVRLGATRLGDLRATLEAAVGGPYPGQND